MRHLIELILVSATFLTAGIAAVTNRPTAAPVAPEVPIVAQQQQEASAPIVPAQAAGGLTLVGYNDGCCQPGTMVNLPLLQVGPNEWMGRSYWNRLPNATELSGSQVVPAPPRGIVRFYRIRPAAPGLQVELWCLGLSQEFYMGVVTYTFEGNWDRVSPMVLNLTTVAQPGCAPFPPTVRVQ